MSSHRLHSPAVGSDLSALVRKGIREADPAETGPRDWVPVTLALEDDDGTVIGGLYGATMWQWLMIDGLWVATEHRGQGLGRRLLLAAEEMAVERGCTGSWLGTFDFQARGFYEAHGYEVFAELPGFPPGHLHYHLRKDFGKAVK
ncbi:GNAT family N-acetyltransferase [Luteolibacter arcticus]|uniref:GNAT family N-acetyltransferase n=1 Tax=Luteolibacter arcticus TaxID=1581411 RepID=A0ABT3GKB6_9BACT|nr:GNAT family N-acetyltransferase [Luteolibacter arcticus]MCW1923965.1 GNAT family N-acetyltransferase [Luteolibacter arcticus]